MLTFGRGADSNSSALTNDDVNAVATAGVTNVCLWLCSRCIAKYIRFGSDVILLQVPLILMSRRIRKPRVTIILKLVSMYYRKLC